jgi:hypothetical protein
MPATANELEALHYVLQLAEQLRMATGDQKALEIVQRIDRLITEMKHADHPGDTGDDSRRDHSKRSKR